MTHSSSSTCLLSKPIGRNTGSDAPRCNEKGDLREKVAFFVQAIQASFAANRRNSGCAQSVPYFGERGP